VKAVAYLRVSQEDETVENQKQAILSFAEKKKLNILGFFSDEAVSGQVPPRKHEGYKAMLKFCKENNIKTIVFYDLSRLARSVEEGLNELKLLAEEGFNFYFAGMDFLNYDLDPMMKKKIIMDFLWFAEMYVEDIKRRTRVGMSRLKREGKLYYRPTLLHYIALYLSEKSSFRELTREDYEKAREYVSNFLKPYLRLRVPIYQIKKLILDHFSDMYRKYPKAPKSYDAVRKLLKDIQRG